MHCKKFLGTRSSLVAHLHQLLQFLLRRASCNYLCRFLDTLRQTASDARHVYRRTRIEDNDITRSACLIIHDCQQHGFGLVVDVEQAALVAVPDRLVGEINRQFSAMPFVPNHYFRG